jgi:two-component system, OmpR family, sensor kinase
MTTWLARVPIRAVATVSTSQPGSAEVPNPELEEPGEAFAQLLSRGGRILDASEGFRTPLLRPDELSLGQGPTFFQRRVVNVVGTARLLAVPVNSSPTSAVLIVGTTMADRSDALRQLGEVFLVGGPAAIALACLAGWIVAGLALHPMERMRQQAAAITASGLDRRLTMPPAHDHLRRLAETLNDMLERLDQSFIHEREFLERASHELRTPLAALRAEVDLSLNRRRSPEELATALHSVSQETDRLARLAEDLLVLARAHNGRLPLHRQDIGLRDTLESAAALFTARALGLSVTLTVDAPQTTVSADPVRLRQALVNLLDNALRHTPRDGAVRLTATVSETVARIVVSDTGHGFADAVANAVDYDSESSHHHSPPGLGLRIVHAVATSHRGTVRIARNDKGGGTVEITLPRAAKPQAANRTGSSSVVNDRP